jgi:hypothetical protein
MYLPLLSESFYIQQINDWCPLGCAVWIRAQATQQEGPLTRRALNYFPTEDELDEYLSVQDRAYQGRLSDLRALAVSSTMSAELWLRERNIVKFMCEQPYMPVGMAWFAAAYMQSGNDPWAPALSFVNRVRAQQDKPLHTYGDYESLFP